MMQWRRPGALLIKERLARLRWVSGRSADPALPTTLWRNSDYWLLLGGQSLSDTGSAVVRIALPLLVLSMTGSYAQAGLVGAIQLVPYLLLSLPAGALVDRWNRRRVMMICDLGRALCAASIALALALGLLTLPHLYLAALISGAFFVFFNLAEVAALPRVVPSHQLPTANVHYHLGNQSAGLIGPPLGALFWSVSHALPFLADAVSDAISVFSLVFITRSLQPTQSPRERHLVAEIREGLRWLWAEPVVRLNSLIILGYEAVMAGLTLLLIALATRLGASAASAGILIACAAAGGMVGALLVIPLRRRYTYAQLVRGSLWLATLFFPLYLVAPHPAVIGLFAALQLCAATIFDVMQFTYRQARIPEHLHGRVNSVFRLFIFLGQPLGLAIIGVLLERAGPIPAIWLVTGIFVALATLAALNRHVRHVPQVAEQ